jgi:hypothetical protein
MSAFLLLRVFSTGGSLGSRMMFAIRPLEPFERLAAVQMLRVTIMRIPLTMQIMVGSCSVSFRGIAVTVRRWEGDNGP